MAIYLTGDTHLDHGNIIKFCNRPFSSCKEMNEEIIKRWNSRITPKDEIYHLGDFCMSRDPKRWIQHLDRLNGRIYLIKGNHDKDKTIEAVIDRFVWVKDYYYLNTQYKNKKISIILMHYAMRVWNRSHHGSFHAFSHSHGCLKDFSRNSMDVGVDTNNYYPYHINEFIEKLGTL